ncbi:MAG: hypothetical protein WD003_02825, partial [Candidatus Paceibacterota bacterium]
MNKNLIIEGKNHISVKRASEITGYTNDYIGQLCRAGKIDAKRIERRWFVCEESLLGYIGEVSPNGKGQKKDTPENVAEEGGGVENILVNKNKIAEIKKVSPSPVFGENPYKDFLPELEKKQKSQYADVSFNKESDLLTRALFDEAHVSYHKEHVLKQKEEALLKKQNAPMQKLHRTWIKNFAPAFLSLALVVVFAGAPLFLQQTNAARAFHHATEKTFAMIAFGFDVIAQQAEEGVARTQAALHEFYVENHFNNIPLLVEAKLFDYYRGVKDIIGNFVVFSDKEKESDTLRFDDLAEADELTDDTIRSASDRDLANLVSRALISRIQAADETLPTTVVREQVGTFVAGISRADLELLAAELRGEFVSYTDLANVTAGLKDELDKVAATAEENTRTVYNTVTLTNKIDDLGNVVVHDSEIINSSFSGGTGSFLQLGIATLSAGSANVSGDTTLGNDITDDTLTINARIATSLIPTVDNSFDLGDAANWLRWRTGLFGTSVAIGGTATSTGTQLTTSGGYLIDTGSALSINTTNNQEVYLGSGNVGIGTTSPIALLTIGSSTPTNLTADTYYNSAFVSGDLEVGGNIHGTINAGNLALTEGFIFTGDSSGSAQATSTLFIDGDTGNVGIGTTNSTQRLSISNESASTTLTQDILNITHALNDADGLDGIGTGLLFSAEDESGSATSTARILSVLSESATTSPASYLSFSIKNLTGSLSEALRIDSGGNVGIASTSPSATLSVNGTAWFTGQTLLGTDGSNVGIGTTSPFATLSVAGSGFFNENLTASNITATGTLSISGTSLFSDLATFANGFISQASSTLFGLTVSGNATTTGNTILGDASADTLIINAQIDSNLIPTTNATYDLGSSALYWNDAFIDAVTVNTLNAATTTISGTEAQTFTINTNNMTADTEDMDIVFFRGTVVPNALIGWDSTLDKFDINQPLFIQNDSSTTTVTTLDVRGTSAQTADLFRVRDFAGSNFFNILSTGNVGIGTTSPASLLDIWGDFRVGTSGAPTLFTDVSTGRVGIGTTNPEAELHIVENGHIILQNDGAQLTFRDSANTGRWSIYMFDNNLRFLDHQAPGGLDRLVINDNGNIGIGTTSPFAKLSVAGSGFFNENLTASNITATGTLSISGTSLFSDLATFAQGFISQASSTVTTGGLTVGGYSTTTQAFIAQGATATSTLAGGLNIASGGLVYDFSSGNVGVGTTSPDEKLHVQGTIKARKTEATNQDNLIKILSTADTSSSDANWRGRGVFGADNLTTLMGVYKNQALIGAHSWTSANAETGAAWAPLYLNYESQSRADVYISTNVGIGTTSPDYPLDVDGDFRVGKQGSTNALFVDATNARVGIGTTSPGYKLEIADSGDKGGSLSLINTDTVISGTDNIGTIYFRGVDSDVRVGAKIVADGSANWGGATYQANTDLKFYTADATVTGLDNPRMVIKDTGNVGIGTTSPAQPLHVIGGGSGQGAIRIDNTGTGATVVANRTDGSVVSIQGATNTGNIWFDDGSNSFNIGKAPRAQVISGLITGQTELLTILNGGNVGIGTTGPSEKLEVSGNIGLTGDIVDTTNSETLHIDTNDFVVDGKHITSGFGLWARGASGSRGTTGIDAVGDGSDLQLFAGGSEHIRVKTTGNVGIGTTSPSANLEIYSVGGTAGVTTGLKVIHANNSQDFVFQFSGSSDLLSKQMVMTQTGNVGIGTTTPGAKFQVVGSGFFT